MPHEFPEELFPNAKQLFKDLYKIISDFNKYCAVRGYSDAVNFSSVIGTLQFLVVKCVASTEPKENRQQLLYHFIDRCIKLLPEFEEFGNDSKK